MKDYKEDYKVALHNISKTCTYNTITDITMTMLITINHHNVTSTLSESATNTKHYHEYRGQSKRSNLLLAKVSCTRTLSYNIPVFCNFNISDTNAAMVTVIVYIFQF